jgi:hypothetical protein
MPIGPSYASCSVCALPSFMEEHASSHAGARECCLTHRASLAYHGTSPARWQKSSLSRTAPDPGAVLPVPGTAVRNTAPLPEKKLKPLPSGTTVNSEPGHKIVLTLAHTASKVAGVADVNDGASLHHNHWKPVHHGQVQQAVVPDIHGFGALHVASQAYPTAKRESIQWLLCG